MVQMVDCAVHCWVIVIYAWVGIGLLIVLLKRIEWWLKLGAVVGILLCARKRHHRADIVKANQLD
jgi:membrane associated rhomboid family serine protease